MNVSFDLFTELIGYRFFIQQRVLDDVAFRIGHHDVVVGNFDIFARFLPIFHTFEEDITVVFTEVQIAVLIFHNVVNCITSVLVLEIIEHVVGSPMIPRHHVIPVAILHRKFDATFTDNVFKGDAFLTWNTGTVADKIQCLQTGAAGQFFIVAETSFGIGEINIGQTQDVGVKRRIH